MQKGKFSLIESGDIIFRDFGIAFQSEMLQELSTVSQEP
jgi:hypothetical protein